MAIEKCSYHEHLQLFILLIIIFFDDFSHELDPDESGLDKARAAFNLMGYVFSVKRRASEDTGLDKPRIKSASVNYMKRNIRNQNRQLQIYLKPKPQNNTHIYFDDEGNPMCNSVCKAWGYSTSFFLCFSEKAHFIHSF